MGNEWELVDTRVKNELHVLVNVGGGASSTLWRRWEATNELLRNGKSWHLLSDGLIFAGQLELCKSVLQLLKERVKGADFFTGLTLV